MFLGSFSWSFVYVSLPFHIHRISALDEASTLRWTGWILGISSLVTVLTAPAWGSLASRGNPKRMFVIVQTLQGVAFFGTAAARTMTELFLARLLLGSVGAVSTFAFVGAGRASTDLAAVRREVGAIQSGMTLGQVIGPLIGAITAARLGFRASCVVGGLILIACSALVHWGVAEPGPPTESKSSARRVRIADVVSVAAIVLGGSTQIFFFTSVLPQVLPRLGIAQEDALEVGGILIFASGVAIALGAMAASRLGEIFPERQLIATLLVASSLCLAALGTVSSVWLYGILRFLQVLCIAPVFPIIVARIALHAGGQAIGFINSARIAASAIGPVMATSLLASDLGPLLYVALALVGLACLPLVTRR